MKTLLTTIAIQAERLTCVYTEEQYFNSNSGEVFDKVFVSKVAHICPSVGAFDEVFDGGNN